ncbi:hypothetical protein ACFWNK_20540 [Streptomyces sp. NPDC058417]|uniref:hypothetical protein n=1 Tax=unclassified Streptomyces TaxID=2593676 RepID=UPI003660457C
MAQLPAGFPKDDIPAARMRLTKELRRTVRQARRADGLTLYLPVERMYGVLVPASFVASAPLSAPRDGITPEAVLRDLAKDAEDASVRELDGTAAVRTSCTLPADPEREIAVPSRRVQYTVPIPDSAPAAWLTFTFSALIAADMEIEFTEILVELFDAVMTTFRWSHAC